MFTFQNPAAFFLLLFVPAFYALRSLGVFKRISFPVTLADWGGGIFEWKSGFRNFASHVSSALAIAGFIMAVAALASPVVHREERVYTSRGADIVFVVDTSPSMAAKDIVGMTRIEAAKRAIHTLAVSGEGASYGLVAMATEAALMVPPTQDKRSFLSRLDTLSVGGLGDGSAISTGLSTAVYHLVSSAAPKKCIVLVTDGENNAGSINIETAAELAAKNGIAVYALGIGTQGAVPLDYVDTKTGKVYSGYLQSEFDPAELQRIAALAGGSYYGVQTISELANVLSQVTKESNVAQAYYTRSEDRPYYDRLILVAAFLFTLAWIIRKLYLSEIC